MVEVTGENKQKLWPLFAAHHDTSVQSCLQGHMGRAWADSTQTPTCAKILLGDFALLAGDAANPQASQLIVHLPEDYPFSVVYFVGENNLWNKKIEECWPGQYHRFSRYAIQKDSSGFCPEKLKEMADYCPNGYRIMPMNRELCHQALSQSWSVDFCAQFESVDDFLNRGMGYAAVCNGTLVAGAASYAVFDGGIEVTIATRPDHRRKGLARVCAAQLVLSCLQRGLYPNWDARTLLSVEISRSLGYHFSHEYTAYEVKLNEKSETK